MVTVLHPDLAEQTIKSVPKMHQTSHCIPSLRHLILTEGREKLCIQV